MRVPLVIGPGLNRDDTPFAVADTGWRDVDKVRFWRGKPQVIGGWEAFAEDQVPGVTRTIFPWTDTAGNLLVAFGSTEGLFVNYGGALYDITPVGFVPGNVNGTGGLGYGSGAYSVGEYSELSTVEYFPLTWSLSAYGETLIANPRGQTIYQWSNNVAVRAVVLTNAPARVTYTIVAPGDRRQVIAFGCNEVVSGVFNPVCIRGSDIENPTDWSPSTADNAFENILEGGGRIAAARAIGDYLHVWTDSKLYFGTFVGSPGQAWRFDQVDDHCGLIGPNAVVVVGQTSYWMGTDAQFFLCPMGGQSQIIASTIQAEIQDNLNPIQTDKVTACSISQFGEVRWDLPDTTLASPDPFFLSVDGIDILSVDDAGIPLGVGGDQADGTENNRYVSLNTLDGSWSGGLMSRTAFVDAGPNINPLAVDPYGDVYLHERGQTANGDVLDWHMETADQYIGTAEQFLMLKGIWPDFEDQVGTVNLEIITRKYPQATEKTHGPYVLAPNRGKKDFRASGRVARIRISAAGAPSYVRLGKPQFEAEATGRQ